MQQPMATLLALLICGSLLPAAGAALMRGSLHNRVILGANVSVAETPEELAATRQKIHQNWNDMDTVLENLFVLACKYRNGKDIHGAAAEKLKNGEVKGEAGYDSAVRKGEANNLEQVNEACGFIVASQTEKCKKGCSVNWASGQGKFMENRVQCSKKCDDVYIAFGKSCKSKAEALAKVYKAKASKTAATDECHKGWCPAFPSVYIMEDSAKMKAEVTKRCDNECSDAAITDKCTKAWLLNADLFVSSIKSDCSEKTGVMKCFKEKKEALSKKATCSDAGKKECAAAKATCEKEGKTDATFKSAQEFCDSREKMCTDQATAKCLADHKAGLDEAQVECEKEAGVTFTKCTDEALAKKKEKEEVDCKAKLTPKCKADCAAECKVDEMTKCLKGLETDFDITKDFCRDFWSLLHESSEVDPITGDPIVLLSSSKPQLSKMQ